VIEEQNDHTSLIKASAVRFSLVVVGLFCHVNQAQYSSRCPPSVRELFTTRPEQPQSSDANVSEIIGNVRVISVGAMTVQELLISRSLYSRAMNELDAKGDA
jgi:hypothetical protein